MATTITGYQEVTEYSDAVTVAYKKTETIENYTPDPEPEDPTKPYKQETIEYNYVKQSDGSYKWIATGDPDIEYVNHVVEGEVIYERTTDGGDHWDECVWDNPTDMGTTYTKTVTTKSWDGDGYDTEVSTNVTHETTQGTNSTRYYNITKTAAPDTYSLEEPATADTAHHAGDAAANVYRHDIKDWNGTAWVQREITREYSVDSVADAYKKDVMVNGEIESTSDTNQATAEADVHYDAEHADVVKTVNDTVIGTVTLVNAANAGATLLVNGADIYLQDFIIESDKGGTLTGTVGNDTLIVSGGSSATFNSLAGNDVIQTKAKTNTYNYTAGTDAITVSVATAGKDDTIALSKADALDSDSFVTKAGNTYSFDLNGDTNADITYTNDHLEKLAINNGGTKYNFEVVTANVDDVAAAKKTANTVSLINGEAALGYVDGKGNDLVYSNNNLNNRYTYANGGTDVFKGGNGNDTYNVVVSNFSNAKDRLVIADSTGADILNLEHFTKDNVGFYFDVDSTGNNFDEVAGGSADLVICNKNNVKTLADKHIVIQDYDTATGGIETVNLSDRSVTMATTINTITTAVQGWLTNHGFASTVDVMANGNQYDQASLLACFNRAEITTTPLA